MKLQELNTYDYIIVAFSGGKDSTASLLALLDLGVSKDKIELWHHDIDGREGSKLMDWAVTGDYCKKFAAAFGLPIYFSWKQGGFEREMNRNNQKTAPVCFETPTGLKTAGGIRGKEGTRQKFPQVSADLSVRWCSAYLKIDVCSIALNNQERFIGKKILLVTGERAQESSARAKYQPFEVHKTSSKKKTVHQLRIVHSWTEKEVWAIIEKFKVNPHPAYKLGWGRVSCAACIFGSSNQWASLNKINPSQVSEISNYETKFGLTINRNKSVPDKVKDGQIYDMKPSDIKLALSNTFDEPIILSTWELPKGAFGESCGPS